MKTISKRQVPKNWLLIGGAGYIGSHTLRELQKKGSEVIVLDNLTTGVASRVVKPAKLIIGDARESNLIREICNDYNITHIMNFAAYMQARESVANPMKYWKNNLGVAISLAEAISLVKIKHVLLSSSCSVYGNNPSASSKSSLAPLSPYAYTKVASEQVLEQACTENGIKFTSLRYFNVIGGGGLPNSIDRSPETLLPSVCREILNNRPPIIFVRDFPTKDGKAVRDYLDVRDLATAHVLIGESTSLDKSEFMNISTGIGISVLELVREVLKVSNSNLEPTFESARIGDPGLISAVPSMQLIELGWKPRHTFEQSIQDFWNEFKK